MLKHRFFHTHTFISVCNGIAPFECYSNSPTFIYNFKNPTVDILHFAVLTQWRSQGVRAPEIKNEKKNENKSKKKKTKRTKRKEKERYKEEGVRIEVLHAVLKFMF